MKTTLTYKIEEKFKLSNNPSFENWQTAHFFIVSIFTTNRLHKKPQFKHLKKLGAIQVMEYFKQITDEFEDQRERYNVIKLIGEERYTVQVLEFISKL